MCTVTLRLHPPSNYIVMSTWWEGLMLFSQTEHSSSGKRGELKKPYRDMWNLSFRDKVAKQMKCFLTFIFLHSSNKSSPKRTEASAGDQITAQKVGEVLYECELFLIIILYANKPKGGKKQTFLEQKDWKNAKSSHWISPAVIHRHHHFFQGCRSHLHNKSFDSQTKKMHKVRSSLGNDRSQRRILSGIFLCATKDRTCPAAFRGINTLICSVWIKTMFPLWGWELHH